MTPGRTKMSSTRLATSDSERGTSKQNVAQNTHAFTTHRSFCTEIFYLAAPYTLMLRTRFRRRSRPIEANLSIAQRRKTF